METRLMLVCLGFPILVIESLSHINNRRKGLFLSDYEFDRDSFRGLTS